MSKSLTKKELKKIAEEINKVAELEQDDKIDPKQDQKNLLEELQKCVGSADPELDVYPEDDFSEEGWEILAKLGNQTAIEKLEESENESKEDESDEDDSDDEKPEESDEDESEESEESDEDETDLSDEYSVDDINKMKKKALLDLVNEHDLDIDTDQAVKKIKSEIIDKYFSEEENEEEEEKPEPKPESKKKEKEIKKTEKADNKKEEKSKKAEKEETKTEKSKKMNKYDAACTSLKNNPKSFDKALKSFMDLYDIKESSARSYLKIVLKILGHFDVNFDY